MVNDSRDRLSVLWKKFFFVIIVCTLITSLHFFWPKYFPYGSLQQYIDKPIEKGLQSILNLESNDNEPLLVPIEGKQYTDEKVGVAISPPTGWHLYMNKIERNSSLILRKEPVDFSKKTFRLDQSPYLVIYNQGPSLTYPPSIVSTELKKSFEKNIENFKIRKNEIVSFGDGTAIKIEGEYHYINQVYSLTALILERFGNAYVMYFVHPQDVVDDKGILQGVCNEVIFLSG